MKLLRSLLHRFLARKLARNARKLRKHAIASYRAELSLASRLDRKSRYHAKASAALSRPPRVQLPAHDVIFEGVGDLMKDSVAVFQINRTLGKQ